MDASTPDTTRPPATVKVALLGAGNVGAEVARTLLDHGAEFAARVGAPVELVGIAVRDLTARRTVELPEELLTTDAEALVDAADVVIELTGGIEPARSRILRALHAGKPVISGNKALIARHGRQQLPRRVGLRNGRSPESEHPPPLRRARPGVDRNLEWLKKRHPSKISAVVADIRDETAVADAAGEAQETSQVAGGAQQPRVAGDTVQQVVQFVRGKIPGAKVEDERKLVGAYAFDAR